MSRIKMELFYLIVDGAINTVAVLGIIVVMMMMASSKAGAVKEPDFKGVSEARPVANLKSPEQSVNVPVSVVCGIAKPRRTATPPLAKCTPCGE